MAHLIHSLTRTAKSVITLPLNAAKAVAGPALRRVGVRAEEPQVPQPRTPPPRRTAEEAVARERASEPAPEAGAAQGPGGTALDDEKYDEYDEPARAGNAAAAPGAGADSGSRKKKRVPDEPVLDTAAAKAVRSEAATMRKAADPRKDS